MSDNTVCPRCRQPISGTEAFCPSCGLQIGQTKETSFPLFSPTSTAPLPSQLDKKAEGENKVVLGMVGCVVVFIVGCIGLWGYGALTGSDNSDPTATRFPTRAIVLLTPEIAQGRGDSTAKFHLVPGLIEFTMTHSGTDNFIVWIYAQNGDKDLIVNEIGSYSGRRALQIGATGTYTLDVQADGAWTIQTGT